MGPLEAQMSLCFRFAGVLLSHNCSSSLVLHQKNEIIVVTRAPLCNFNSCTLVNRCTCMKFWLYHKTCMFVRQEHFKLTCTSCDQDFGLSVKSGMRSLSKREDTRRCRAWIHAFVSSMQAHMHSVLNRSTRILLGREHM